MVIALFIVSHGGTLGHLRDHFQRNQPRAILHGGCVDGKFQVAQRLAHIAACALGQVFQRIHRDVDRRTVTFAQALGGVFHAFGNILCRQGFELEHCAAG